MDAQHVRRLSLVVLLVVVAGCAAPGEPAGGASEPWSFTATDGTVHARDDPANATVLFFMATWCGSCVMKAPVLAEAHAEMAAQGVRFLSLDFDPTETKEDLDGWREKRAQPWPHGIDGGLRIQRAYGVTTQSTVLVLDSDGAVVERFGYGNLDADAFRAAVDEARA